MLASTRSSSLLVLIVFVVLLLKSLQAGLRHGPLIPLSRNMPLKLKSLELVKRTSALDNASDAEAGGGADRGVQITGYWKDVRSSLGLTPLSGVILVPSGMDQQFNARDSVDEGGEMRLQRLGRLIPGWRRRESAFTSASNSSSVETQLRGDDNEPRLKHTERDIRLQAMRLQHEHTNSPSTSTRTNDFVNSESSEGSVDELQTHVYSYSYSLNSPPVPDLFIAGDAHNRPRTPVSALAASFRAIAARELKTHHGSRAHTSGTRPGSTRHGDRSRR